MNQQQLPPQTSLKSRSSSIAWLLLLFLVGLPLSRTFVHVLTESWWFAAVGFSKVFWTRLSWQILIGVVSFLVYALFLWGNYRLAVWLTRHHSFRFFEDTNLATYTNAFANWAMAVFSILVALLAASISGSAWETLLKFLHPTPFAQQDPIFQKDLSFYLFRLPFLEGLWNWLFYLVGAGLLVTLLVYGLKGLFAAESPRSARLITGPRSHLLGLLSPIALLVGGRFWLSRYQLLYSTRGVLVGAGYTDVHAQLFAYTVMILLSVALALVLLLGIRRCRFPWSWVAAGVFLIGLVLINGLLPWMQQKFLVEPNELVKEKPYIAHSIQFTQQAYRLDQIQRQGYAANAQLTAQILQANKETIENIRLWDYRPLLSTYRQLQEIRLYYKFLDVDVDRYNLNNTYQQVMLSARELETDQLPPEARTWVNQRLKYTHGYGLVMSPVNRVTSDGLPELYIRDIPPTASVNLPIQQAAIYYGEATRPYIFTGTATQEFDYPMGNTNAANSYSGTGGVPIPSIGHRLAYAFDLSSLKILLSGYFTPQSRIHYYRSIQERVHHIAPFLRFDGDPYLVVINGRLQWIVDAYTVSSHYPYAEAVSHTQEFDSIRGNQESIRQLVQGNVNYIRNSVKVLVDAYDGTVRFFAIDETDPVLRTYQAIFPKLFQPAAAIAANVKAHFRYPQDLFTVQAQMYRSYHMSDPDVFYNREDQWRFPLQTYEGNEMTMEPYYVLMHLPAEASTSFIQILPFTPINKDNMIAWLAARSNGPDYGKLLLYEFPKQKLVYGPRQIEALIDQDPQISQQFTLWSQSGSRVIRGNLLVIPIQQSLLYVEPVYLRAEQGEFPQLKRVIVAYDKSVAMAETLDQALAAIFGGTVTADRTTQLPVSKATFPLARSALEAYQKAESAARQGNWSDYGRYQQELKQILQQLN